MAFWNKVDRERKKSKARIAEFERMVTAHRAEGISKKDAELIASVYLYPDDAAIQLYGEALKRARARKKTR